MLNSPDKEAEQEAIKVHCYFVRHRNALAVRAQFSELYTDFYLHLMQHGLHYDAVPDQLLKDGLAALTLHLASRPRTEATAWTLNVQEPLLNLFVTGSSRLGNVTGRAFVDDVKQGDANLFFSQVTEEGRETRQSTVEFDETNAFRAVESYYRNSEQRPARYFQHGDEDFVMLTAQPDCDMPWFLTLDDELVRTLDDDEELSLLEVREYRFDCGCSLDRMYPIIASLPTESALEVFDSKGNANAQCPRCGAGFALTREGFKDFLQRSSD
jgi:molecular chaperone Hsp33